ncbi:hypothetical protein STEG23_019784 [Scotinomys teguina]
MIRLYFIFPGICTLSLGYAAPQNLTVHQHPKSDYKSLTSNVHFSWETPKDSFLWRLTLTWIPSCLSKATMGSWAAISPAFFLLFHAYLRGVLEDVTVYPNLPPAATRSSMCQVTGHNTQRERIPGEHRIAFCGASRIFQWDGVLLLISPDID